jgi:hypothetical protein
VTQPDPSLPIPNANPLCRCVMTSQGTTFSVSISPGCIHHAPLASRLERGIIGGMSIARGGTDMHIYPADLLPPGHVVLVAPQEDGVQAYCLCHGWTDSGTCRNAYAVRSGPPGPTDSVAGP